MLKISVCMATYNGEKYIKAQLESILSQLRENDEVIISDDVSLDKTIEIVKSLNDKRIFIIQNNKNIGVVSNFNKSLSHATGEIIFLSDQDDIWMDNKVALCVEKIKNHDLIVTNCMVTDQDLNIIHSSYFKLVNAGSGFMKNMYKSTYLGCCLVFNKKVLDKVLPMPNNFLLYHDWWIGFIADTKFSVYFEKTPLLLYRRHSDTTSPTISKSKNSFFTKTYSRLQLLFLGLNRLLRKD